MKNLKVTWTSLADLGETLKQQQQQQHYPTFKLLVLFQFKSNTKSIFELIVPSKSVKT